jgi:hypothetical protein
MNGRPEPSPVVVSATSGETWALGDFVGVVLSASGAGGPFDAQSMEFCAALSARLLGTAAHRHPQLVALGYWLRSASLETMRRRLDASIDAKTVVVPRGRVFHVTPANVDTLFAYSWTLGVMTGNSNIVRLSSHETSLTASLVGAIGDVLRDPAFAAIAGRNWLIRTAHSDQVAGALSGMADLRVIWGGNDTIEHFRRFPLPLRGRDVVFPDRHSIAIIEAGAVASASTDELTRLADRFFNDAYAFDQAACSSPRLIVWVATPGVDIDAARRRFHDAVAAAIVARSYRAELGTAISKEVFGLRIAAAVDGVQYERASNEATWIQIPELTGYDRAHCGGGLFLEYVTGDLAADLGRFVVPSDQTAVHYGLDAATIRDLAVGLRGRGIDRWVPVGHALDFNAIWDGYDLPQEFIKRVSVSI